MTLAAWIIGAVCGILALGVMFLADMNNPAPPQVTWQDTVKTMFVVFAVFSGVTLVAGGIAYLVLEAIAGLFGIGGGR